MEITKNIQDHSASFVLSGRLDTLTSPQLEKELQEIPDDLKELVLDFGGVEYISSAGLRVLLSAQKVMARQGGMKLIHVNEMVMEIFEVTGFSEILNII